MNLKSKSIIQILLIVIVNLVLVVSCAKQKNTETQKTYNNPIIPADYSDPDVIRVGNDYYLTASSFNVVPGLPILHSKDLMNWKIIGHGVQELPDALYTYRNRKENELDYNLPRPGKGVYAPCIRYHDGYFWIFWADPDAGLYMVKAKKPEGPWSKPHLVKKAHGWIDPTPVWDNETKQAWIAHAYAASRSGINSRVVVAKMNWDGTKILTEDKIVFDAKDSTNYPAERYHKVIEGCKFMKRNGYYYILSPAGGVPTGWQTALRAKTPEGPYEIKTICETGTTKINGPHQGGLIGTPSGEWWFAHFQSVNVLGRIVLMQPAKWENDWPSIGVDLDNNGIGNPVTTYDTPNTAEKSEDFKIQTSDDFSGNEIGLQWQWLANTGKKYCSLKNGELVVKPHISPELSLIDAPNVITQMFYGFNFEVTAKVKLENNIVNDSITTRGGLSVMGQTCFDIGLEQNKDMVFLSVRQGENQDAIIELSQNEVYLKLEAKGEHPFPLMFEGDQNRGEILCQFSYSIDGKTFTPLGESFQAVAGTWIGARIGLYCLSTEKSETKLLVDDFKYLNK